MHERTYTVLRLRRAVSPEAGASPFAMSVPAAAAAGPDTLEIHKASLSEAERADVRRDPRVMAIAEAMPMSLIAPREHEVVEPLDAVNWGVSAVRAPDSPFTGDGITVAVLDTGIDADHEAFQGVELIQRNFTTEPLADSNGHGTHCAGTIFGRDVGGVRIGVARGVRRAVIGKMLGQGGGSSSDVAQAIQWAVAQGAHVLSMSLGIDFPGFVDRLVRDRGLDVRPATSIALEQYRANVNLFSALAATIRAQGSFGLGSVVFAAAGNESDRPRYEIAASPPAAGTDVVAIGALARSPEGLRVAGFSNHQVDVAAPGVDIVSARAGGGLRSMSGTSMATPHVAGVAALWAERLRHITGRVESPALMAQVVASGSTEALAKGFEEDDVGTGCVQAPLD